MPTTADPRRANCSAVRCRSSLAKALLGGPTMIASHGSPPVCTHSTSRVVLPKPAGAESRVTWPLSPAFRRSMRRARGMTSLLARGRLSSVRKRELGGPARTALSCTGSWAVAIPAGDAEIGSAGACSPERFWAAACSRARVSVRAGPSQRRENLPARVWNASQSWALDSLSLLRTVKAPV